MQRKTFNPTKKKKLGIKCGAFAEKAEKYTAVTHNPEDTSMGVCVRSIASTTILRLERFQRNCVTNAHRRRWNAADRLGFVFEQPQGCGRIEKQEQKKI